MKNLEEMTPEELGELFPIKLVHSNPNWPLIFIAEKERLMHSIYEDDIVAFEHIGSTAIPYILAKDTIDIVIGVKENELSVQRVIHALTSNGYTYIARNDNPPPHAMLVKGYAPEGFQGQAFHIHLRHNGPYPEVAFRDYLIANPTRMLQYQELKQKLAQEYLNDRDGYTDAKECFVRETLIRAKRME